MSTRPKPFNPAPAASDIDRLAAHLQRYYSPEQLSLYYWTLTDGKPIPDCQHPGRAMPDAERQMRIAAIDLIRNREREALLPAKTKNK